jgi:hypothetical protein
VNTPFEGEQRGDKTMENAAVQKKQSEGSPSVVRALWDPFGFMQEMFGWGRSGEGPLFEVKETDDNFVCKVKVNLTLPDQADVAHAKAELENGELTLVVPKAAATTLNAESAPQTTASGQETQSPSQTTASGQEAAAPPRRARRAKGTGSGSPGRGPRRGARARAGRGR